MRRMRGLAMAAAAVIIAACPQVRAELSGMPMVAPSAIRHIEVDKPTLPPVAYTAFCLRYESECRTTHLFRGGPVPLTKARWADLKAINLTVNHGIAPDRNQRRSPVDPWLINPTRGNCSDYAVSKRHELIKRGWPARTLLLSEVETGWGEHHLVLVVRTKLGDLVLDNLTSQITQWSRAPYVWIRIQLPNTQYWDSVASGRV